MAAVVEIIGLRKKFGSVQALDGIDLTVDPGQVQAFLGPNGAGKTTTIRCLLGLLRASAGEVRLFGRDAWKEAVDLHKRLSYVPGDVSLWDNFTGGEVIDLFLSLHGSKPDRGRRQDYLRRFDLDPAKKCRAYSKGNRQKVALVAALAATSELYVLDEPSSGLDPLLEKVFQDCVHELKEQGKAVLLSSHIMSEVEKLADQVSLIKAGRIVFAGPLEEILRKGKTLEELFLSEYVERTSP
jgi:ABC-2 type transport system ATP-binding protein